MTDGPLDRLLGGEGRDPGCEAGFELLDQYCEAVRRGDDVTRLYPDLVTHIQNCRDCREDTEALLAALKELEP
jgi:hypothetical protein